MSAKSALNTKQLFIHAGEQGEATIASSMLPFIPMSSREGTHKRLDFASWNARRALMFIKRRLRHNVISISVSFFVAPGDMLLDDFHRNAVALEF